MLGGVAGAASFGDARLEISFDDRKGAARRGRRALPWVWGGGVVGADVPGGPPPAQSWVLCP